MTDKKSYNIIITGVGGQGVILASTVLGMSAIDSGKTVKIADTHGLAQRGGSVISFVRIGNVHAYTLSEGEADVLLAFEPMEALRNLKYLKEDGIVIVNTHPIVPVAAYIGATTYPPVNEIISKIRKQCKKVFFIDATSIARKCGTEKMVNTVMLGALSALDDFPIKMETILKNIRKMVPPGTENMNENAFKEGRKALLNLLKKV
ncbi:indolepyruvate ferredoxin oxidoreductase subunit beta [archaeon]|nr:MAG: indolepyruvate ferredoxin oxidoreductase subunit beta [archaeon]